jgi:hypothetical protein
MLLCIGCSMGGMILIDVNAPVVQSKMITELYFLLV